MHDFQYILSKSNKNKILKYSVVNYIVKMKIKEMNYEYTLDVNVNVKKNCKKSNKNMAAVRWTRTSIRREIIHQLRIFLRTLKSILKRFYL